MNCIADTMSNIESHVDEEERNDTIDNISAYDSVSMTSMSHHVNMNTSEMMFVVSAE